MNNRNINYTEYFPYENKKNISFIFTHGIAEYSKSYIEFSKFLQNNGYHVIAYDLHGHGKSGGIRGSVENYDIVIEDLKELVDYAYTKSEKVILYGHSMGGVITNLYVTLGHKADGIIIAASPIKLSFLLWMIGILPKRKINDIKIMTNFTDKNLAHENTYIKDEDDLDYFYLKYINEVVIKGIKKIKKEYQNVDIPSLFIYSKGDKMAKPSNGRALFKMSKSNNKELIIYEKSRHNLHLDIEHERLYNDVVNWLNENFT